jgi:hypothetical protein
MRPLAWSSPRGACSAKSRTAIQSRRRTARAPTASTRGAQHLGSTMGAHYRHTTPEMATRVVMAIQDRLVVVVSVAEQVVEAQPTRGPRNVF